MSARSARQHKAWGAARAASKPQDRNPKRFQPAERAKDVAKSHDAPMVIPLSPASRAGDIISIAILGRKPLYAVVRTAHCAVEESQNRIRPAILQVLRASLTSSDRPTCLRPFTKVRGQSYVHGSGVVYDYLLRRTDRLHIAGNK